MKKLASLILALAMCLALGAPAFATSQTGSLTTELSSQLPELKVTLPTAATIILNPYRNTVQDTVAAASAGIDKGDKLQIMSAVFSIVSTTSNKLHIEATATGSVGGNAEFSSNPVAVGAAGHKVNLTLTYAFETASNATAAPTVFPAPNKVTNPTNVKTISDSEQTLKWDLPATTASTGAGSVQRLNLQFGGTCSDSPSQDEGPWTDSDTVSCAFVFTVTPVTDFPMVTAVFQATDDTPTYSSDFEVNTTKPTDFKEIPSSGVGIEKIEYKNAADTTFTELAKGSDNWGGSTWDGTKITLKSTKLGDVLGATAATKVVKFTLSYTDKSDATVDDFIYMVKVTVLDAPEA
jgi:hypothetical protein